MNDDSLVVRDYASLRAAFFARRAILEMSQADLATASGLTLSQVRRFERGLLSLSDETLPAMLKALRLELHLQPRRETRRATA